MELQQIRYYLALSRTLNFTRAAEECHVTQPALTRAIQALEAELGGELVRRERSNTHLTELGKRMLPLLQSCYDSAVNAKDLAKAVAEREVMMLSVGVSQSVPCGLVAEPLAELFGTFPGLQLRVRRGDGPEIVRALRDGEIDVALAGPLDADWERLDRWPVLDEDYHVVVGARHPLATQNAIGLGDIAQERLIVLRGCEQRAEIGRRLAEAGKAPTLQEVDTVEDLLALVGAGAGVAIVAKSAGERAGLRHMPLPDLGVHRTLSVYAVAGRRRSPAAGALLNLMRAQGHAAPRTIPPEAPPEPARRSIVAQT